MRRRPYFLAFVFLLCLCAASYSNALQNKFTSDDHALISENPLTQSFRHVLDIFQRPLFGRHDNFYRPLTQLYLMVAYFFFQLNPLGYHIVNILTHALVAFFFFALIDTLFDTCGGVKPHLWQGQKHRLSINPEQARHNVGRVEGVDNYALSLLSAALYVVHPIHHTLINLCSQNVTLVALCMLSSCVCLTAFLRNDCRRRSLYYCSFILFFVALFIREDALLLPLYMLCVLLFLNPDFASGYSLKRRVYVASPFFIGSIGYFIVRLFFFSLKSSIWNEFTKSLTLVDYVSGYVHLLGIYLRSLVVPRGIVWMFTIPVHREYASVVLISFVVACAALAFMAVRHWKKGPQSFGLAWFFVGAAPTMLGISNRPFFGLSMETHWFYLPSMGIFLLAGSFLLRLKKHINAGLWICFIASILLFYACSTRAYNALSMNPKIYNEYWMSKYPNNLSREILAKTYLAEGDYKKAESLLKEALFYARIDAGDRFLVSPSHHSGIYNRLGRVYALQGRASEAVHMFNAALRMDSSNANAYFNLAGIFLEKGRLGEAVSYYEKAVAFDPFILVAWHNLAILYARRGDNEKALQAYAKAVALDKDCFTRNVEQ